MSLSGLVTLVGAQALAMGVALTDEMIVNTETWEMQGVTAVKDRLVMLEGSQL